MRTLLSVSTALILALSWSNAGGEVFTSQPPEDAEMVEDAEVIVVGRLLPKQVRFMKWPANADNRKGWEYWSPLEVTEVIKGEPGRRVYVIILHFGIEPTVGGKSRNPGFSIAVRDREDRTTETIELYHRIGSLRTVEPFVANAEKDAIWFLNKHPGSLGKDHVPNMYGVKQPWEVQPLELRPYFKVYTQPDPEAELKVILEEHPEWRDRAANYLMRREIQRIQRVEDPDERVKALMPLYLKQVRFGRQYLARMALIETGEPAAKALIDVFRAPEHRGMRSDVIYAWGDIGFPEAIPLVMDMLAQQDEELPGLRKAVEDDPREEAAREALLNARSETYAAAAILEIAGARRALPNLRDALERWDTEDEEYLRKKIEKTIETLENLE